MSAQKLTEATNSGYVSSEETDSLLVSNTPKCKASVLRQIKMSSVNGPTSNTSSSSSKPTLIRQDRTSSYLTSPQQARIGSEENVRVVILEDVEQGFRSAKVPGIEVHSHEDDRILKHQQPTISISNISTYQPQDSFHPSSQTNQGTSSYQNLSMTIPPSVQNRCRACRNCSRRASTTPISTDGQMDRSASRESVKSAFQQGNLGGSMATCASIKAIQQNVPPLLVTSSPTNGSRIIRQSSQPESCSSVVCCGAHSTCGHSHTVPNVSLKQLRDNTTDGFAGIAADSLRINGGMRPFKQNTSYIMETSPSSSQPELDRKITSILQHDKTLFGEAKELNVERLPTYGDILLHYFFMQEHYFEDNPHISFQSITRHVADKIVEIWNNLPTPIIQRKSICNKLDRFMAQYREASKNKSKSPDVLVDFRGLLGNLFWVSTCNCNLLTTDCRCQNTPLPLFMKTFFVDQMTDRNVTITEFLQTLPQPSLTTVTTTEVTRSEVVWQPELSMGASSMYFEFEEGVAAPGAVRGPYMQNVTLSNFAMECDRYGISNRAAAALASALLKDLSVKDKNDQTLIIDKNKVQRERNRCRNEVLKKRLDTSTLLAFAFDSRTDETLVTEFINNKNHTRKIKEPHIVVVREPDSRFLGHIIVEEETAEAKTQKRNVQEITRASKHVTKNTKVVLLRHRWNREKKGPKLRANETWSTRIGTK